MEEKQKRTRRRKKPHKIRWTFCVSGVCLCTHLLWRSRIFEHINMCLLLIGVKYAIFFCCSIDAKQKQRSLQFIFIERSESHSFLLVPLFPIAPVILWERSMGMLIFFMLSSVFTFTVKWWHFGFCSVHKCKHKILFISNIRHARQQDTTLHTITEK